MKEQLISFETAKLAKEKGFKIRLTSIKKIPQLLPTQSLLQKWLRKKHNIYVLPYINDLFVSGKPSFWVGVLTIESIQNENPIRVRDNFNSYEEALEIGLQEALKLI